MSRRLHCTLNALLIILLVIVFIPIFAYRPGVSGTEKKSADREEYSILIDIETNMLYLLRDGKSYLSFPCATGAYDSPSPQGLFKIIQKSTWGEGFGGCWMGLNCTWGNYGIHGTTEPGSVGYPVSHGCFRLRNEDCEKLYSIVSVGTYVYVTGGCYGDFGGGFRTICPGMYGSDVLAVQKRLTKLGFYKGLLNGRYDAYGFRYAVHRFQKSAGLTVSDEITYEAFKKMGFVLMD